eukprot:TRINITY_DN450_c0_g1_i1.p1 TRINITY_DN450_c0_g1~~TRINITY_DN450_c0_g1_i1.p1  ORF type:complete len:224 (-),score=62.36 TRINITY_DN450_c0_g1_i1:8-679(-)
MAEEKRRQDKVPPFPISSSSSSGSSIYSSSSSSSSTPHHGAMLTPYLSSFTDADRSGASKPAKFKIPDNDFFTYLLGSWKRNLEWRELGGAFQHLRTSNTIVLIEEYQKIEGDGTRHLKWSFGKTISKSELHFGYIMKFVNFPKNQETYLEWVYTGTVCHGKFMPASNVAILNFFQAHSTVLVVYRVVDADTMAVCIIEIDEKQSPTLQYGNMYRIDPSLYKM